MQLHRRKKLNHPPAVTTSLHSIKLHPTIDGHLMRAQLHHEGAGAVHVKFLDIRAILVERAHVVGFAWVERDEQRWR